MSEPKPASGRLRWGDASEALRYGRSGHALRLEERIRLPRAGDRWRPLPGAVGLELVDRQGRPLGWCYVRTSLLEGE